MSRKPVWNLERDAYHPAPWTLGEKKPAGWIIYDAAGDFVAEIGTRGVALAVVDAINQCAAAYFNR